MARSITNDINLSGSGGLVWFKMRDQGFTHRLVDTERGVTKKLESSGASVEGTEAQGLTAFNSDGFTIGTADNYNLNNADLCAWTFRKQPKFFDVVTYTGTGSAQAIAHSLGSVPGMIITKGLDTAYNWGVFHRSLGNTKALILDVGNAADTGSSYWNNTDPTSTHFTVGSDNTTNDSGENYVAYLFAHNADSTDSVQTSLQGKTLSNLGSAFDGSYPITNINDGVAETSNANSTGYVSNADMDISVDYGSAVIVNAYYIAPQGDQGGSVYNTPTAFTAYGSNDGSSWTSLASFSSISGFAAGSYKEFTFSNTTAYRYYRLEVTASSTSDRDWETC